MSLHAACPDKSAISGSAALKSLIDACRFEKSGGAHRTATRLAFDIQSLSWVWFSKTTPGGFSRLPGGFAVSCIHVYAHLMMRISRFGWSAGPLDVTLGAGRAQQEEIRIERGIHE